MQHNGYFRKHIWLFLSVKEHKNYCHDFWLQLKQDGKRYTICPLTFSCSSIGQEERIKLSLWTDTKTGRSYTSYCHGQNRPSCKCNLIYCQLRYTWMKWRKLSKTPPSPSHLLPRSAEICSAAISPWTTSSNMISCTDCREIPAGTAGARPCLLLLVPSQNHRIN